MSEGIDKLKQFEFQKFFLETLLWDRPPIKENIYILNNESCRAIPIASQGGFLVFLVQGQNPGTVPYKVFRERIAKKLRTSAHEHLLIFTDFRTYSIWHWIDVNGHNELKIDVHEWTEEKLQMLERIRFEDSFTPITTITQRVYGVLREMSPPIQKQRGENMATIDQALNTLLKAIQLTDQALCAPLGDPGTSKEQKRHLLDISDMLDQFLEKAKTLKNEWESLKETYPLLTELAVENLLPEGVRTSKRRVQSKHTHNSCSRGDHVTQLDFEVALLRSLVELGGRVSMYLVINRVHELLKNRLTPRDYELVSTGEERWRNSTRWVRQDMINKGYLRNDSPKGTWEITDEGREHLRQLESGQ